MPAARPTQSVIENALRAVVQTGHMPGAVVVQRDGSFRIEIIATDGATAAAPANEDQPPSWED